MIGVAYPLYVSMGKRMCAGTWGYREFTGCKHRCCDFYLVIYTQADCISGAMDVIGKLSALDYEELCATEDMLPLCVADLVSAPANVRYVQCYGILDV